MMPFLVYHTGHATFPQQKLEEQEKSTTDLSIHILHVGGAFKNKDSRQTTFTLSFGTEYTTHAEMGSDCKNGTG